MSDYYRNWVNENCDPDDDDSDDEEAEEDLPHLERCPKCGQNFIAELIYDACPCEAPVNTPEGPIPF